MDPRLEEINQLLINYSLGEFDNKIQTSDKLDEIDAFISNINMLGEELKISTISRNYFNNIFNSVSDMLFVLDNKGMINSTNRAGTEKLGYAENQLKESSIGLITRERSHFFDYIKKELDRYEAVISFDSNMRTVQGEEIPVNCSCSYLYNQNKEKIGYLLIARDQSILRKYEQFLIESEAKYRDIFEKSSDCLFIISHEGKLIDINDAGVQLFKFAKEVLYTKTFFELISDSAEREFFEQELRVKEFVIDFKLKVTDVYNTPINCLVSVSKAYNKMGEPIGYQGIVKDMSRQREIENLLVRTVLDTQEAERNRVAKDLHDSLGQKLSGIKFHIETLNALQKNASDKKYIALLTRSKDELSDAIKELSNISFNIMPGTLQDFGLSYAIKELCNKLKLGSETLFEVSINDSFPSLDKALEMSIFRITQEFINNSIKHGNATKISIRMDAAIVQGSVLLHLQDNGKGFDIKKITKPGMGLKNMQSRIDSYNGTLKIDSKEGWGTKYEILLPYTNIAK